jgi:hypothetical protein
MSVGIWEQAIEAPSGDVIDSNLAAPGIADQQVVADKRRKLTVPLRFPQGAFGQGRSPAVAEAAAKTL